MAGNAKDSGCTQVPRYHIETHEQGEWRVGQTEASLLEKGGSGLSATITIIFRQPKFMAP